MSRAGRREWIGLAVIALPCILYSMDLTVLNLAVPALSADLKPSGAQLLWIVDIYGFMVAGCLITMGTLGDRIGRRRLLMIGAAAFGVASVLAAFSTTPAQLIASRALLGIAAATLAPSTLSLIRNMFHDPRERTTAIAVWVMSYSAGAAIGPVIGGVLLEYFWWGSVFLINVPVMVLLLALAPILLPEFRDPQAGRMDIPSAAQSLVAVLAVIYGLKRIAEHGPSWVAWMAIAAGFVVGALFVRRQRRLGDPLIDLALFRIPAFSAAIATNVLGFCVIFAVFLLIAQYLQSVLGLSPLQAGLWGLPSALAFVGGSMVAPAIVRRLRPAHVIAGGMAFAAAGFGVLTAVDNAGSALGMIVAGSVILSLGVCPVVTLTTDLVLGSAPPERAGAASAISETSSEFGGALGIALLGSVVTSAYRSAMAGAPPDARDTLGGAVAFAAELPVEAGAALLEIARSAYVQAFELSAAISAAVSLAVALFAFALLRQVQRPQAASVA
jgi:DHA2 family multidrug resistance protein-like MFS transporter